MHPYDPGIVGRFDSYKYLSSTVAEANASRALRTVAKGKADQFKPYGTDSFVARVGHVVLAAGHDREREGILVLRGYQHDNPQDAERRYAEMTALFDTGGI